MRYIGVDMAKDSFVAFLPDDRTVTLANEAGGFRLLEQRLRVGDILGVESTGQYHHGLARFFLGRGFDVRETNPVTTNQFIRSTVRKKKTDKTDAEIISRLLAQGEGHSMTLASLDNPLRKFFRIRQGFVRQRTALKLQLQTVDTGTNPAHRAIVRAIETCIAAYDRQIEKMEAEMLKITTEETVILESVCGLSPVSSRSILAELGDVKRFGGRKQIVAFAGLDPKLAESGVSVYRSGKLTKRGSPYLRHILFLSAFANARSKNVFGAYYWKKRAEGKTHKQAGTATGRKMLEVIHTLVTKGETFRKVTVSYEIPEHLRRKRKKTTAV